MSRGRRSPARRRSWGGRLMSLMKGFRKVALRFYMQPDHEPQWVRYRTRRNGRSPGSGCMRSPIPTLRSRASTRPEDGMGAGGMEYQTLYTAGTFKSPDGGHSTSSGSRKWSSFTSSVTATGWASSPRTSSRRAGWTRGSTRSPSTRCATAATGTSWRSRPASASRTPISAAAWSCRTNSTPSSPQPGSTPATAPMAATPIPAPPRSSIRSAPWWRGPLEGVPRLRGAVAVRPPDVGRLLRRDARRRAFQPSRRSSTRCGSERPSSTSPCSRPGTEKSGKFKGFDDAGRTFGFEETAKGPKKLDEKEEKKAKQDRNAGPWESVVVVGRDGDLVLPAEIVLTFADGTTWKKSWDAARHWIRFRVSSHAALTKAEVDPAHRVVLDRNPLDNALRTRGVRGSVRGGGRLASTASTSSKSCFRACGWFCEPGRCRPPLSSLRHRRLAGVLWLSLLVLGAPRLVSAPGPPTQEFLDSGTFREVAPSGAGTPGERSRFSTVEGSEAPPRARDGSSARSRLSCSSRSS